MPLSVPTLADLEMRRQLCAEHPPPPRPLCSLLSAPAGRRRALPLSKIADRGADSVEGDAGLAAFLAGPFTPRRSRSFTSYPQDVGAYPQPNTGCGGRIRPCPGAANMRSERDPERGGYGDRSSWGTTIRTPCSPERSRLAARREQGRCKDAG